MITLDQITPIKDQVLVVPDPVKAITDGGIHIPETVRADNPNYFTMTGVVVRAGPGAIVDGERKPIAVSVGDRIVFGRYEGKQIETAEGRVLMLREEKIMGLSESYVEPGYQAPNHRPIKGTARPADSSYDGPSAMVIR